MSTGPAIPIVNLASPNFEFRIGGAVILLVFGVLVGWAAIAPLDAGALAPGEVAVAGHRQSIQHREGGVVDALHVVDGDNVRRGQILIEIGTGELRATERALTAQMFSLIARRARLQAERSRAGQISSPVEFFNLDESDRQLAEQVLELQKQQFAAGADSRVIEQGAAQRRVGQLVAQLHGFRLQATSNREQLSLIEDELRGMRSLAAQGYAPITRVRALERAASQLRGDAGGLEAQIASTEEQIEEARFQLAGVTASRHEAVADELSKIDMQINELRPKAAEARAQVEATRLRAPADGEVVALAVHTVGGVAQPGQILMEIVPRNSSPILLVRVNPADVDNIQIGLETEVRFTGLRELNPPKVRGRITRLSADAISDERSGSTYYRAEVTVPTDQLARLGPVSRSIRPGMPVETMVVLRKRTVLSFLLEPLTQSLWLTRAQS